MEPLTVVDGNDKVIGDASFEEVYKNKLTHRLVHVLVFNNKGELLLQKIPKEKSFCPQCWTTSAGGHVKKNEEYEEAAKREVKEELGISLELEFFSKELYVDKQYQVGLNKFIEIYKATYEGPFNLNYEKVEHAEFLSFKKIKKMIENDEKFTPELIMILNRYFGIKK